MSKTTKWSGSYKYLHKSYLGNSGDTTLNYLDPSEHFFDRCGNNICFTL